MKKHAILQIVHEEKPLRKNIRVNIYFASSLRSCLRITVIEISVDHSSLKGRSTENHKKSGERALYSIDLILYEKRFL